MAVPVDDWRLPEKRRLNIQKLEEAYNSHPGSLPSNIHKSPQELETAIYEKSKKGEEYNNFIQQILFMLARGRNQSRPGNIGPAQQQGGGIPQQVQQVQQVGGQPTRNMMNTMNMQQVGMNPSAPNYNQPHYQQVSSGIRPNSIPGNDMGMQQPPQYGHPMYPRGGGMAPRPAQATYNTMRMPNQQGYQQRVMQSGYPMNSMVGGPMTGGGGIPPRYTGQPTMMTGGVQGMGVRSQMAPGVQHGIRPNTGPGSVGMGMPGSGMGQPNSVLAPSSSGYIGVHSVQAISNPSYSGAATSQSFSSPASVAGMQASPRPPMSEPNQYTSTQSAAPPSSSALPATAGGDQTGAGVKGQQGGPGSIPGANPPTPHSAPMQGSVPSPAPPTPLLPASPATSGVGSPAQQPTITPEENEAYMRKLGELQKHIPLLQKWITRMGKDDKNSQLTKLRTLHNILTNSSKRVPISTLMRCGDALDKMFNNDREHHSSTSSESGLNHPKPTLVTSSLTQPHTEPVVPQSKLIEPQHSQSLHEFKMVPSPPSSFESLMDTIQAKPLPAERLPPTKRMCNRDEPSISPGLMRELALIANVKVDQIPKENRFDKSTTLKCSLNDDGLSPVPPLTIRIPPDYPLVSPVCDLNDYHNSTNSTLVKEVGRLLSERLSRSFHSYSLSSLLSDWEMCVLRAMASQLLTSDIS